MDAPTSKNRDPILHWWSISDLGILGIRYNQDDVRPISSVQHFMGVSGEFDLQSDAEKGGEKAGGLHRRPEAIGHCPKGQDLDSRKRCSLRLPIGRHARQRRHLSDVASNSSKIVAACAGVNFPLSTS